MSDFKSGFVAIVGRPNVGKSTLLNRLLKQKIAIVSSKPQTTRNTIQAVLSQKEAQIIFIDTPGIHQPKHKLGRYMNNQAQAALKEVDIVCLLVDAAAKWQLQQELIEKLRFVNCPVFLVVNKIDLITTEKQEEICTRAAAVYDFAEILPISARNGNNLDEFVATIIEYLPKGPKYYPDDWVVDHPERFIIAEFIREQILHNTEEEIPHSTAVDVDEISEHAYKDLIKIRATIFVERSSQRGIIIGKHGTMIKKIGSEARFQIENLLGVKVFLDLWVKVKKDWRNKDGSLSEFGYH